MQINQPVQNDQPDTLSASQPLAELLKPYFEHLRVRNYCASTIEAQAKHPGYFQSFCDRRKIINVNAVGWPEISSYQIELHQYRQHDGRPLAAGTQRQWLTDVVSFFRWLVRKKIIPSNPAAELEMPRTEHRLPKNILNSLEVERVIAVPNCATSILPTWTLCAVSFASSKARVKKTVTFRLADARSHGSKNISRKAARASARPKTCSRCLSARVAEGRYRDELWAAFPHVRPKARDILAEGYQRWFLLAQKRPE